jgi:hypothetical protein
MVVIFARFRFRIILSVLVATIKKCFEIKVTHFDCCDNTKRNYTKSEVNKNNCYFTFVDLSTFELDSHIMSRLQ